MGVYDRLCEIRDRAAPVHPAHRPPYIHQVPLEFIPRLGPKAYERLLTAFGTEMAVLHDASYEDLVDVVGVRSSEQGGSSSLWTGQIYRGWRQEGTGAYNLAARCPNPNDRYIDIK